VNDKNVWKDVVYPGEVGVSFWVGIDDVWGLGGGLMIFVVVARDFVIWSAVIFGSFLLLVGRLENFHSTR